MINQDQIAPCRNNETHAKIDTCSVTIIAKTKPPTISHRIFDFANCMGGGAGLNGLNASGPSGRHESNRSVDAKPIKAAASTGKSGVMRRRAIDE